MRYWTEASFDAAASFDSTIDGAVVWLDAGGRLGRRRGAGASIPGTSKRAAAKAARMTSVVSVGCMAATLSAGAALAPVSSAQAAIEHDPIVPIPTQAVAAADLDNLAAPPPATVEAMLQALHRREVDAFLSLGGRTVSRPVVEAITRAAAETEVDPIYLVTLADTESSLRVDVKAPTSSAQGLFQFIDRTWLEAIRSFGARHGLVAQAAAVEETRDGGGVLDEATRSAILDLRRDPFISAVMAAEMLKRDAALIGFRIGRKLSETEMYLAHFLGLEEAARFIDLRDSAKRVTSATGLFPAAARANAGIFFDRGRRGRQALSVSAVYAKLDRMIGGRLSRYQGVASLASASGA